MQMNSIRRPLILAVVALGLGLAATALAAETLEIWPEGAPGAKGTEAKDKPTLQVYLPAPAGAAATKPAPAVLLCPGGGYKHHSSAGPFLKFFSSRGVAFFYLKYRLPIHGYRHPAPLQDAQRAMSLIRANAKKWNLDPTRLGVLGFSSGGHVASTLATHYHLGKKDAKNPVDRVSCRPDFVMLFCPVITMKDHAHRPSVVRLLGPQPDAKLLDELSNELQVDAKTPPAFLAHAKDDRLVPPENSMKFAAACKKAGVPCELHLYETGSHGFFSGSDAWQGALDKWLRARGVLPAK